jgi:hypothetical protein
MEEDPDNILPAITIDRFASVLKPETGITPDENAFSDPLLAACRYVAQAAKIQLLLKTYEPGDSIVDRLSQLSNDSQCRIRLVSLVGKWAFIGF